jgi:hypothetical protein
MKPTKIGVLGSGDVVKTLGSGFVKFGNEVMIGTRGSITMLSKPGFKGRPGPFQPAQPGITHQ